MILAPRGGEKIIQGKSMFWPESHVTVWERTRRGKDRGCGDSERSDSKHRGGQRGAEGVPGNFTWPLEVGT